MEVEYKVCEHCDTVEDDSFVNNEISFEDCVDSFEIIHETNNDIKLGKHGVIKWLLNNATKKQLSSFEIDEIVNKCMLSSEIEMIDILKQYGVFVEINTKDSVISFFMHEGHATKIAARKGNPEIVSWLLNLNHTKYIQYDVKNILLSSAIRGGNKENIIMLINLGASLTDYQNLAYPLELMAIYGYLDIIHWIVTQNIIPNNHISYLHALHAAIRAKHCNIVQYLVANTKLDINTQLYNNNECKTVIDAAVEGGNVNIILWLIEKGAKLFVRNNKKTIVNIAVNRGHINLLKWLCIQGGDLISSRSGGKTLLHLAAEKGHLDCVKYLVHKKFDVNAKDQENESVLHYAVASKNVKLVKFLIDHGANIHVVNNTQYTLLHKAHDCLEILQLLVPLGIDLYTRENETKLNVLNLAARCNNYEVVCWLLDQGMDIKDVESESDEWLDKKSFQVKNNRLLQLCIKNLETSIFHPTFLVSVAKQYTLYQEMLKRNVNFDVICPKSNITPLIASMLPSSSDRTYRVTQHLLEQKVNVTHKNDNFGDALYFAIRMELNLDIIKKIVELGGNVNTKSPHIGYTALGEAVGKLNYELVEYLVSKGADINAVDLIKRNALCVASMENYNERSILKLISLGADPNYYNDVCKPILIKASEKQNIEFVSTLLKNGAQADLDLLMEGPIIFECLEVMTNESKKLQLIDLFLNNGVNINVTNPQEQTLIYPCIENIQIVDYLIKKGIYMNHVDEDGFTCLHEALAEEHYETNSQNQIKIVKKLLYNGADVNITDESGHTALQMAASNKHCSDIARLLVQKGASVNAKDIDGNSVLHFTYCQGDLAMWLCELGADINAKNKAGLSVLQKVIENMPENLVTTNVKNIVNVLENRAISIDTRNKSVTQSFLKSIENSRYLKYLQFLLDNVDNVEKKDEKGMTAMHYAVAKDNMFVVQLLLQKRVNILDKSGDGNTVLHSAASAGSLSVVTYILEHMKHELLLKGNNVNETPLHLAVISNNVNIVKLLLKHGVEVDHKNNKNMTALHFACKHGNLEIVKLLLSNGANLYETCTNMYTPIHMAIQHCKFDVFECLLEFESQNPNSESNVKLLDLKTDLDENLLHVASKHGCNETMQYFINNQVYPIDSLDKLGNSALHLASTVSLSESLILLVKNGANINLKNKTGNTPLHFATKTTRPDVIGYLLRNGANAKAKNIKGNMPVHIAASFKKACNYIDIFIRHSSVDILYIKNREGNTVFHLAAATNHILKNDKNINLLNQKNQSPLVFALKHSSIKFIKSCSTKEAINTIDIYGNTLLHLFITKTFNLNFQTYLMITEELCKFGGDLTLRNKSGETVIHMAFRYLDPIIVTTMIQYTNDVNVKDENGYNVLHMALNSTLELPVIEKLFKTADLNAKTNQGESYLHVAINNHPREIVLNWLVPKCKNIINEIENVHGDTVLLKCVRNNRDLSTIQLLVENGADIHCVDKNYYSVLHLSAIIERTDLIKYFSSLIN